MKKQARLDVIFNLIRQDHPERSIRVVSGPREIRGWTLSGTLPAILVFDFTMQDIDGPPEDVRYEVDGEVKIIDAALLPAPILLPRSEAVIQARKIAGLEPLDPIH
jgi:hypothetical protein